VRALSLRRLGSFPGGPTCQGKKNAPHGKLFGSQNKAVLRLPKPQTSIQPGADIIHSRFKVKPSGDAQHMPGHCPMKLPRFRQIGRNPGLPLRDPNSGIILPTHGDRGSTLPSKVPEVFRLITQHQTLTHSA
jgi:hypothetical protein